MTSRWLVDPSGHSDDEELQRLRNLTHSRRGYQRLCLTTPFSALAAARREWLRTAE